MDLRYPVGAFSKPAAPFSRVEIKSLIADVAETPERLRRAVGGLSAEQLDVPYRPDGWTSRQVAHHLPDSHMYAFIRLKLALTETEPTIMLYDEAEWAKLPTCETPLKLRWFCWILFIGAGSCSGNLSPRHSSPGLCGIRISGS
jgi:hypothetical protein